MSDTTTSPAANGALRPAKAPVGVGSAPLVAQLIALALVVLGGVGIQDTLSATGVITQESWIAQAVSGLDGTTSDAPFVLVAGIVLALLGLLALPAVVLRRPRTSVELVGETGVHLRTRDLARILTEQVEGTDSVTDVRARAKRRKVSVQLTTLADRDRNQSIRDEALERVQPTLDALASPPRVRVSVRNEVP